MLNRLWVGNAGGAVTALTALHAVTKDGQALPAIHLLPVAFFFLGLLLLGAGAGVYLVKEARVIREMENADTFLELTLDHVRRPSELAGLSLAHPQTLVSLAAAVAFALGLVSGFIALLVQTL